MDTLDLPSTSPSTVTLSSQRPTAGKASVQPPALRSPGNPSTTGLLTGQIPPRLLQTCRIRLENRQIPHFDRLFRRTINRPATGRRHTVTFGAIVAVVIASTATIGQDRQGHRQPARNQVVPIIGFRVPGIQLAAACHGDTDELTLAMESMAVLTAAPGIKSHVQRPTSLPNGKSTCG